MTNTSKNMECPVCRTNIKLRDISPRSNPIYEYPALRQCPSCRTALCFAQPRWMVPAMVVLALVGSLGLVFLLQSFGIIEASATAERSGRQSKAPGVFIGFILGAVLIPAGVWLTRSKMQISIATRDDLQKHGWQ